eukprot:67445-Chlamydomonas_euryale.AAC.1
MLDLDLWSQVGFPLAVAASVIACCKGVKVWTPAGVEGGGGHLRRERIGGREHHGKGAGKPAKEGASWQGSGQAGKGGKRVSELCRCQGVDLQE